MYALTLTQPWATLVALRLKGNETRSWQPPRHLHKQQFAIHAGKGLKPVGGRKGLIETILTEPFRRVLVENAGKSVLTVEDELPLGAIVAVATLADVGVACLGYDEQSQESPAVRWSSSGRIEVVPSPEVAFGDYTPGRKIWKLANVIALPEPVKCSGWQMLWRVSPEIEAEIQQQLPTVGKG